MEIAMPERAVVLIDLANISYGVEIIRRSRNLSPYIKIDYRKLVSQLTLGLEIIHQSIYVGTDKNGNPDGQKKFLYYLNKIGFNIVTKECKIIRQDDGTTKKKANFDVEIATDCCTHIWKRECDEIILISGDSDFNYLVQQAIKFNFKFSIVSTRGTISTELIESSQKSGRLILLDDIDLNSILMDK